MAGEVFLHEYFGLVRHGCSRCLRGHPDILADPLEACEACEDTGYERLDWRTVATAWRALAEADRLIAEGRIPTRRELLGGLTPAP